MRGDQNRPVGDLCFIVAKIESVLLTEGKVAG